MPDGAWGSKEPSPLDRLVAAREAEKNAQRKKDTRVLASLAVVAPTISLPGLTSPGDGNGRPASPNPPS